MYWDNLRYSVFIFLVAIDKVGNAFAKGNPNVTISARCYWLEQSLSKAFCPVRLFIDFAFYPYDGKDHCLNAYINTMQKGHDIYAGPTWALIILSIIAVIGSIIPAILGWACVVLVKLYLTAAKLIK